MHCANVKSIENNDADTFISAKRLAGMIRILKEQIIKELDKWHKTNVENCQLKIKIQHFQQRLNDLNVLCSNYQTSNAEIGRQKKRYSEQLSKISKLICEQNFDAANWAIILDEMAFVNRELFEILMSTAAAERHALQIEIVEEEKYKNRAKKLVLKRIKLRQALYSEMERYESLNAEIYKAENNLINLQKTIDVYDAEYWQLNDTRQNLQSQIFQLEELLRQSESHYQFCNNVFNTPKNIGNDDDKNMNYKSDESSIIEPKYEMPHCRMSKKENDDFEHAKVKGQMGVKKITDKRPNIKAKRSEINDKTGHETLPFRKKSLKLILKMNELVNETSDLDSNIRSKFSSKLRPQQSTSLNSMSSSNSSSHFHVRHPKILLHSNLPVAYENEKEKEDTDGSTSMESFRTTSSQKEIKKQIKCFEPVSTAFSSTNVGLQKSLANPIQQEDSEKMKEAKVVEIGTDQDSTTSDLQSSEEDRTINSSGSSSFLDSDDKTTELSSESITFSDISPKESETIDRTHQLIDIKNQKTKTLPTLDNLFGKSIEIRRLHHISKFENNSKIPTENINLTQQRSMYQNFHNQSNHQVESREKKLKSLSLQYDNAELWEEISEQTFLREIVDRS